MRQAFKILLLILSIFPLWLTIMAMGEESKIEALKARINDELLQRTDRRIQVLEFSSKSKELENFDLSQKFTVELSQISVTSLSTITLKVNDAKGGLVKLIRLPARLYIEDQVPVATHDLSRGDLIEADDFRMEWRDASLVRHPVARVTDLAGRSLRANIKENEPIFSERLQKETLVARGDRVRVRVVGPGLTLTVSCQAMESGSRGQTIKVVNMDSKKEFLGVITDSKEVEVKL